MPHSTPITPQQAIQRTIEHREIFHDEMLHLMRLIMSGEMSPLMTAALITGLRVKKETIGEITAAAQVMREFSTKVHVADTTHLVDIVGTGGDSSHTFNISTCAMFVAAAAGARPSTVWVVNFARLTLKYVLTLRTLASLLNRRCASAW
jgi:anthranilate phosphoribosyltransferase